MSRFGSHFFIVRPHYCLHASNINCCSYVFSTFKRKVTNSVFSSRSYDDIVKVPYHSFSHDPSSQYSFVHTFPTNNCYIQTVGKNNLVSYQIKFSQNRNKRALNSMSSWCCTDRSKSGSLVDINDHLLTWEEFTKQKVSRQLSDSFLASNPLLMTGINVNDKNEECEDCDSKPNLGNGFDILKLNGDDTFFNSRDLIINPNDGSDSFKNIKNIALKLKDKTNIKPKKTQSTSEVSYKLIPKSFSFSSNGRSNVKMSEQILQSSQSLKNLNNECKPLKNISSDIDSPVGNPCHIVNIGQGTESKSNTNRVVPYQTKGDNRDQRSEKNAFIEHGNSLANIKNFIEHSNTLANIKYTKSNAHKDSNMKTSISKDAKVDKVFSNLGSSLNPEPLDKQLKVFSLGNTLEAKENFPDNSLLDSAEMISAAEKPLSQSSQSMDDNEGKLETSAPPKLTLFESLSKIKKRLSTESKNIKNYLFFEDSMKGSIFQKSKTRMCEKCVIDENMSQKNLEAKKIIYSTDPVTNLSEKIEDIVTASNNKSIKGKYKMSSSSNKNEVTKLPKKIVNIKQNLTKNSYRNIKKDSVAKTDTTREGLFSKYFSKKSTNAEPYSLSKKGVSADHSQNISDKTVRSGSFEMANPSDKVDMKYRSNCSMKSNFIVHDKKLHQNIQDVQKKENSTYSVMNNYSKDENRILIPKVDDSLSPSSVKIEKTTSRTFDPDISKYVILLKSSKDLFSDKNMTIHNTLIKEQAPQKRSILDMFNSINKSAVIIQKDFYVNEKISQKIRDEEKKINKISPEKIKLGKEGCEEEICNDFGQIQAEIDDLLFENVPQSNKSNEEVAVLPQCNNLVPHEKNPYHKANTVSESVTLIDKSAPSNNQNLYKNNINSTVTDILAINNSEPRNVIDECRTTASFQGNNLNESLNYAPDKIHCSPPTRKAMINFRNRKCNSESANKTRNFYDENKFVTFFHENQYDESLNNNDIPHSNRCSPPKENKIIFMWNRKDISKSSNKVGDLNGENEANSSIQETQFNESMTNIPNKYCPPLKQKTLMMFRNTKGQTELSETKPNKSKNEAEEFKLENTNIFSSAVIDNKCSNSLAQTAILSSSEKKHKSSEQLNDSAGNHISSQIITYKNNSCGGNQKVNESANKNLESNNEKKTAKTDFVSNESCVLKPKAFSKPKEEIFIHLAETYDPLFDFSMSLTDPKNSFSEMPGLDKTRIVTKNNLEAPKSMSNEIQAKTMSYNNKGISVNTTTDKEKPNNYLIQPSGIEDCSNLKSSFEFAMSLTNEEYLLPTVSAQHEIINVNNGVSKPVPNKIQTKSNNEGTIVNLVMGKEKKNYSLIKPTRINKNNIKYDRLLSKVKLEEPKMVYNKKSVSSKKKVEFPKSKSQKKSLQNLSTISEKIYFVPDKKVVSKDNQDNVYQLNLPVFRNANAHQDGGEVDKKNGTTDKKFSDSNFLYYNYGTSSKLQTKEDKPDVGLYLEEFNLGKSPSKYTNDVLSIGANDNEYDLFENIFEDVKTDLMVLKKESSETPKSDITMGSKFLPALRSFHSDNPSPPSLPPSTPPSGLVKKTVIDVSSSDGKTNIKITESKQFPRAKSQEPLLVQSFFQVTGGSELFKDYESIVNSIKSKIDLSERAVPKEKTTLPGIYDEFSFLKPESDKQSSVSPNTLSIDAIDFSAKDIKGVVNKIGSYGVDSAAENEHNFLGIVKSQDEELPAKKQSLIKLNNQTEAPTIKLQIKLINAKNFGDLFKEHQLASTTPKEEKETKAVVPSENEPTYEESMDKMRKKFIGSAYNTNTSVSTKGKRNVKKKKVYLRPVSLVDSNEGKMNLKKKKIKPVNKEDQMSPSRGYLNESDQAEINNYIERKRQSYQNRNEYLSKHSLKNLKHSKEKTENTTVTLNPRDIIKEKKDSKLSEMTRIGDLIDKYILENYEELNQHKLSLTSSPEKPFSQSLNQKNDLHLRDNFISADKITSFPLANKKKEIGYSKPKEGILNIDLVYNPFLRDKYSSLPSVSKVLNDTMADTSRVALEKWKNNMIQKMGEVKFNEYYAEQLKRGTYFHKAVKDHVMGKEVRSYEKDAALSFQSVEWVLKDLTDVAAVESCVVHPVLGYKGIVDCVGKYKNKPVLIEWKLSNKRKNGIKSTYDAPLQLSAYLGALNYDKNYNFQVDGGLIVVAYADGSPADLFQVPMEGCERFWTLWLNRLSSYASTFSPKILL